MTTKQKAIWSAVVAAVSSFLAWLANTPPEQQDALLGPLVGALPVSWRPTIGAAMKLLSSVAVIYSTVQASHSGTPNPNLKDTSEIDHKTIGTP